MADMDPTARWAKSKQPARPGSLRWIGEGIQDAYSGAVDATSRGMESVAKTFTTKPHVPYNPSGSVPAAPVPAAPTGVRAGLDGMGGNSLRLREEAAGLKDGAVLAGGPGTRQSDSIPAHLSRDEAVLPARTVDTLGGPDAVAHLIESTNGKPPRDLREGGHYVDGVVPQKARGPHGAEGASGQDWLHPVNGFMPGTRAVARGFVDDMKAAGQEKNGAAAFGQGLRATVRGMTALPLGVLEDTLEPVVRAVQPITTGAINAANTAVTGDSTPLVTSGSAQPTSGASTKGPTDSAAAARARGGMNLPDTGAGGGRGSAIPTQNPNAKPANIDNFTDRAAASLRDGRDGMAWAAPGTVYKTIDPKTGTVTYSGRDVSGDISGKMVDGRGNQVGLRGSVGNGIVGVGGNVVNGNAGKNPTAADDGGALFEAKKAALMRGESIEGGGGQNLTPVEQSPFRGSRLRNAKMMAEAQHIGGINDVAMRGQDLSYDAAMTGHLMSKKANQARLQYEMAKDQRDFAAGRADKNFEQRKAREEQIDKQLEGRFVNPETGKPDAAQINEYKQFMQNGLAEATKQLLASKDPQQQALGKALQGRSYADLDPQDLRGLEQAWQLRSQLKEGAGGLFGQWFLNKGRYVDSNNPMDFAPNGIDPRTLGGDHLTTRNGSTISANVLRDSTLGIFPAGTNRFEDQLRQAASAQKLREGY